MSSKKYIRWQFLKDLISILSSITVIAGLVVALMQYTQSKKIANKQYAMEIVNKTNEKEFLTACSRFYNYKDYHEVNYEDFIFILNTYYSISILYNNNYIDTAVVNKSMIGNDIEKLLKHPYYRNMLKLNPNYLNKVNLSMTKMNKEFSHK